MGVLTSKVVQAVVEGTDAPTQHVVLVHGRIGAFDSGLGLEEMLDGVSQGTGTVTVSDWARPIYVQHHGA